jgi:hypothetical protein
MGARDNSYRVHGRIAAAIAAQDELWTGTAPYPFPVAAAATNVVSSNAVDNSAGTGIQSVRIVGLNAAFEILEEVVAMNGTTQVACANQYFRILSFEAMTVGTAQRAAGNVDVRHGSTVLGRILPDNVRGDACVFTAPALSQQPGAITGGNRPRRPSILGWGGGPAHLGDCTLWLCVRQPGGPTFEVLDVLAANGTQINRPFPRPIILQPGTDIFVRILAVTTATILTGFFDFGWSTPVPIGPAGAGEI